MRRVVWTVVGLVVILVCLGSLWLTDDVSLVPPIVGPVQAARSVTNANSDTIYRTGNALTKASVS